MISAKDLNTSHWSLYLVLIPVALAVGLWLGLHSLVGQAAIAFSLLAGISWVVSYFGLQYALLMTLAVLLPFSVEMAITDELNINFPSEPMLVIAVFSICWDFLRKPGTLKLFISREDLWILPLLLSIIITTLLSTMLLVSVKFAAVNITYIVVFYIWQKYLFKSKSDLFPKLLGLYSASLAVIVILSVIQFMNYDWNPVTIRGIFKPFYKDNTIFGATSALIASFWLAISFKRNLRTVKITYLALAFIFLGATILSTSRAAVLSIILFFLTISILWFRIRVKSIATVIIMAFLAIFIFRNQIFDFLKENKHQSHAADFGYVEQLESSGNISSDISNVERLNRWTAGLGMFTDRPITGFGPGTYQFAYIPYQKKEYMSRLTVKDPWHIPENSGGTAHSEYILALSEMGLLGIIAFLILLGRWFLLAFVKSVNHPQRVNIIIGFAVLVTYLFHALFNNFLSTDKFAFLFWGTAAWMVSQYELKTYG